MQELVISILLTVVIIMASVVLIFIGSRKGRMPDALSAGAGRKYSGFDPASEKLPAAGQNV